MESTTTTKQTTKLVSMSVIKALYKYHNPTGHWFDAGTMKFFGCRLPQYGVAAHDYLNSHKDSWYFISSEKNSLLSPSDTSKRLYSIRQFIDGNIHTVSDFQGFTSRAAANTYLNQLLNGGKP